MSAEIMDHAEADLKEHLIDKIREIAKDEKFKLDAYFFCGCPSGTPNEKLVKACEKYLETVEAGAPDKQAAQTLVAELEAATTVKPNVGETGNLVNNMADIQEVLAHKELLLN